MSNVQKHNICIVSHRVQVPTSNYRLCRIVCVKVMVFVDVTLSGVVDTYQCFRRTCRLPLLGQTVQQQIPEDHNFNIHQCENFRFHTKVVYVCTTCAHMICIVYPECEGNSSYMPILLHNKRPNYQDYHNNLRH